MRNEPVLKLALSLHSNPGVYALLIGSGVSRAAGIPTGWEVVLDLIRKVAVTEREDPETDPEAWYRKKYDEPLEYDRLLDRLTNTPAERQALLRSYFEPTEEEREQGVKVPTPVHRVIADLVRHGYIRMILTTNFDRLIERALQDVGIEPDVISTDDDLQGAMPYVHSNCYVVKLHGDYLDTRIKNTPEELASYSDALNTFLDRVFDEFGLIICGWSGKWDTALRNAILRAPNRRFTTYWLAKGEAGEETKEIIQHRRAEMIPIESADKFFTELEDKLKSLRELERPHPVSTAVAVATVKRYVVEEKYRVRLRDLIHQETEAVFKATVKAPVVVHDVPLAVAFQNRLQELETVSEKLLRMVAALAYFDEGRNALLLTHSIERLLQLGPGSGTTALLNLQQYPAMLVMYGAGLAAVASDRFTCLAAALRAPRFRERHLQERVPVVAWLQPHRIIEHGLLPKEYSGHWTPCSDFVANTLRPVFSDYLPDEDGYLAWYDILDYLRALTHIDLTNESDPPIGPFAWRYLRHREENPVDEYIRCGLAEGENWGLLRAGFFGGSAVRLEEAVNALNERTKEARRHFH